MLSGSRAWFVLVLGLSGAAGCKESGQDRPLPTPEPPAAATPGPRAEPSVAPKKRAASDDAKDAAEKPAASPSTGARGAPPAATSSAAKPAASSPAPTASAPAPATPSATPVPTFTAPSAACLSRCQGAMQGCLSAPVDGGVPGFANLDLCKKAFEACQAACAKQ